MRVADTWKRWATRRAAIRELNALGMSERENVARDASITVATLDALATRDANSSDELQRLMLTLSLDHQAFKQKYPDVSREMDVICSICVAKARCRRDLAADRSAERYVDYCPNAPTIAALTEGDPHALTAPCGKSD